MSSIGHVARLVLCGRRGGHRLPQGPPEVGMHQPTTVGYMSRGRLLLGLLLTAALVAHVFMLAGHHHDGARHAPAVAIAALESVSAPAAPAPHSPEPAGQGAASVGAACLVVLASAVFAHRLRLCDWASGRPGLRSQLLQLTADLPTSRPLRPPQTPVVERVVLLA